MSDIGRCDYCEKKFLAYRFKGGWHSSVCVSCRARNDAEQEAINRRVAAQYKKEFAALKHFKNLKLTEGIEGVVSLTEKK